MRLRYDSDASTLSGVEGAGPEVCGGGRCFLASVPRRDGRLGYDSDTTRTAPRPVTAMSLVLRLIDAAPTLCVCVWVGGCPRKPFGPAVVERAGGAFSGMSLFSRSPPPALPTSAAGEGFSSRAPHRRSVRSVAPLYGVCVCVCARARVCVCVANDRFQKNRPK